jgi:hypothetical protein
VNLLSLWYYSESEIVIIISGCGYIRSRCGFVFACICTIVAYCLYVFSTSVWMREIGLPSLVVLQHPPGAQGAIHESRSELLLVQRSGCNMWTDDISRCWIGRRGRSFNISATFTSCRTIGAHCPTESFNLSRRGCYGG